MKSSVNLTFIIFIFLTLFILKLLQGCNARTLATMSVLRTDSTISALNGNAVLNSTWNVQNNTKWRNAPTVSDLKSFHKSYEAAVQTKPAPTQSLEVSQATRSVVVTHIKRQKRELKMELPYDFDIRHMPCDMDQAGRAAIIEYFPNHCIWVWNNKYNHEGTFRVFKLYQLEGFFFGQYYERLKRFETDPHTWDYL